MKPFDDKTKAGNEKAIRRGQVVPDGDVNLAYIKAPEMSPKENIVVIDTSRIIEENVYSAGQGCKLYYANPLGILVDKDDNMVVADEFPLVTDTFSVDEDFSVLPGSEYEDEDILPFRHVSRYFHLDNSGLTMPGDTMSYKTEHIKVVDGRGAEYPHYKIQIVPAYMPGIVVNHDLWAYRIFAFVDTDDHEDLYLKYNKVEMGTDGSLIRRKADHKELINSSPFFLYVPEESDVVDPVHRKEKIYSTKPLSLKDRVLGKLGNGVDGFKVYVPKKAIGDPRLYQLFRWRVKCTFKQDTTIDPSRDGKTIRCGVITTGDSVPSRAPFALYNLSRSHYNASGVLFRNPAKSSHSRAAQEQRDYWLVNLNTADLSQYDLLIWAPSSASFNFGTYAGKINNFMSNYGGTVFIDSNNYTDFGSTLGGVTSKPVIESTGRERFGSWVSNANTQKVYSRSETLVGSSHALLDGSLQLGGWDIDPVTLQVDSLSYTQFPNPGYSHCFVTKPTGYTTIVEASLTTGGRKPVTVVKKVGNGHKIISTFGHLFTCSALFSYIDNSYVRNNMGTQITTSGDYVKNINGAGVEGAMKLLYNAALLAVKGTLLDDSDEQQFSTTWEMSTPWRSSWVINNEGDVLSDKERGEHNFVIDPKDIHIGQTEPIWKRKLSNQTVKEMMDEIIVSVANNPAAADRITGATRTYEIETTNSYVQSGSKVVENDYPRVWTEAYTPKFTVPVELGAHIVKEEVDEHGLTGRVAQYENATYTYKRYPEQPYAARVTATYAETEEYTVTPSTSYTVNGTAIGTRTVTDTTPAVTTATSSEVELSWWDTRVVGKSGVGNPMTEGGLWPASSFPTFGMLKPTGIRSWQGDNYYTSDWGRGHLCWPYWGLEVKIQRGSTGDVVKFLQEALNRFMDGLIYSTSQGRLAVDGVFGPKTEGALRDFQTVMQARYIDGIADAETWSLVGAQMYRLAHLGRLGSFSHTDYTRFFSIYQRMQMHRLSDGTDDAFGYSKRSWTDNGPSTIWEMFAITFDKAYDWHGVSVIPFLEGATNTMMVRSVHVTNEQSLTNYNSTVGQMTYLPHRPTSGQKLYIPFSKLTGDTIIVGVGQDGGTGWGTSRMLGIKDIRGHTIVTSYSTIPSTTTVSTQQDSLNFQVTGTVSVGSFVPRVVSIQAPAISGYSNISNISFTSISVSNPEIVASITSSGRATFTTQVVNSNTGTEVTNGVALPGGTTYYSMDTEKRINPVRETGWVSRSEGIKLLCDSNKRPVGFPSLPTNIGSNEQQRHYVKLSLSTNGSGASVQLGFYDVRQQEFITSVDARAEMSYLEYVQRGPSNIFIAVVTDYEIVNEAVVPIDEDAPRLPYRWAMPVYGLCTRSGSKITLEPLPDKLGPSELWPVAVRQGTFTRKMKIRTRTEGRLSGYLSGYQGSTVEAFYDIPEANLGGWSKNFGPPNADVVNEEPIILDDDVIRVRQAPILSVQYPTEYPNPADPWRPVFTLYKRATRTSEWVEQPFSSIRDYNLSTGEIFLKTPLTSNDASLLRIDYTTTRRSFYFKKYEDTLLNLNTYSGHTKHLIGQPIYIYIVPHYVRDENGNVITESYQEKVLRMSTTSNVFDPIRPEYDPLAVQLGVIYQSTALDIDKVAVLDTRRRGGGISDNANAKEVSRLVSDAATYWDIGYAAGSSYQRSGYVVVRLPEELKADFTENELRDIISDNITAGVGFKIEDLNGRDWS